MPSPWRSPEADSPRPGALAGCLAGLVVVLAAGCGAEAPSPDPPPVSSQHPTGDWLVFADTAEPTTLNCIKATERPAVQICRLVADSLVDFDENLRFIPRLARAFAFSPDGREITFTLHDNVRWHDGMPFTARDVIHSVDQVRRLDAEGERFRSQFGPLIDVTAPEPLTVRAVYSDRHADALSGWRDLLIQPAHVEHDPAHPSPRDREPLGTGPFRFERWIPQDRIVLDANTDYFAGRPRLDRFVYRIVPSAEAVRAALASGEVDVGGLTPDDVVDPAGAGEALPYRIATYPASMVEMIYWNLDHPRGLFRDPRVRRALAMTLNRADYVATIHRGVYRVATTLIDPGIWGGDPDLAPWPYDPPAAARLLDEAGVVDRDGDGIRDLDGAPFTFTLLYTTSAPHQRDLAALVERAGAEIGIPIRIQGLEWAAMRPRMYAHDFEAAIYRWRLAPRPDPWAFFHSSQHASGLNLGGYRSEAFDRLAEDHRRESDPTRSADLLAAMQRRLHEDQPALFVSIPGAVVAVHRRFRHPEIGPAGWWNWYPSLLLWWVPEAERRYP